MAKEVIGSQFGVGGSNLSDGKLKSILTELQGLKFNFVAGAAANTPIALAGITTSDTIIGAFEVQPPTAGSGNTFKTDLLSGMSIPSNGNVQSTALTTGNQILVVWLDKA